MTSMPMPRSGYRGKKQRRKHKTEGVSAVLMFTSLFFAVRPTGAASTYTR